MYAKVFVFDVQNLAHTLVAGWTCLTLCNHEMILIAPNLVVHDREPALMPEIRLCGCEQFPVIVNGAA